MQARTLIDTENHHQQSAHDTTPPWAAGTGVRFVGALALTAAAMTGLFFAQSARTAHKERAAAAQTQRHAEESLTLIEDALVRAAQRPGEPLDRTLESLAQELSANPTDKARLLIATTRHITGVMALGRGELDLARERLEAAFATRAAMLSPLHADVARSLAALGELALAQRRWGNALDRFTDAVRIFRAGDAPREELGATLADLAVAQVAILAVEGREPHERREQLAAGETRPGGVAPAAPLAHVSEAIELLGPSTSLTYVLRHAQALELRAQLIGPGENAARDLALAAQRKSIALGKHDRSAHATAIAAARAAIGAGVYPLARDAAMPLLQSPLTPAPDRAGLALDLAEMLLKHGHARDAEAPLTHALAYLSTRPDDPRLAQARTALLTSLLAQQEYAGAESILVELLGAQTTPAAWMAQSRRLAPLAVSLYRGLKVAEREAWWRDVAAGM
jgi:tetratricopeptide (TPR) repeat protein